MYVNSDEIETLNSLTFLDIRIEKLILQQCRERHDDPSIFDVGNFLFDLFPNQIVQLFGQDQFDLLPH